MSGPIDGNAASTSGNGTAPSQPPPAPIPNVDAPPPFLSKTYDMVDDPSTDAIVSWSPGNNSFVVWNQAEFERDLLPKYFKHNNFASFVRQLNTYGFRKVDSDRFEFANEKFLRGQRHLLRSIKRRKPTHGHNQHQPQQIFGKSPEVGVCVEVGKFGLEEEIDRLKRDKNVLMQELVRLRQQQQATDNQLQAMVQHLQGMEQRQQQMMSFLAKAVQNPGFLAQFVQQQTESNRRVTEVNKKRRLKQEDIPEGERSTASSDGQIVKYQPPISEVAKAMLRQIIKVDASPRLEAFESNSDTFVIDDVSPSFDELDSGTSARRVSGVTLQEVPPSGQSYLPASSGISGCSPTASLSEIESSSPLNTTAEIVTGAQLPDISALAGAKEAPSVSLFQSDATTCEISEMVPESIGNIPYQDCVFMDSSSLGENESVPLDINDMFPDSDIDVLIDCNWEQLLAGIPDETDSASIGGLSIGNEAQQFESGWEKIENMDQLTEQMGLLTSDTKSV